MTKNQSLILDIIRAAPRHMTAEQIFLSAKEARPGIAMATVYNSLGALASAGLIRRLHIVGHADRYDRNIDQHEHLVCDGCGRITDEKFEDFLAELSARAGIAVSSYELNMHYLCADCRKDQQ
ncbi:MAG: transcriptional repressor [Clostridia bacterium]|nr:transcriptional repressor [Clostridia bacterium]